MIAHPVAIVHRLAGADAQQDVVGFMVAMHQVVHVVSAHERHVQLARDRHEPLVHDELLVDALILHLEKKIAGAENVAERRGRLERLALVARANLGRDLPFQAAAQPNQPLGVLGEQLLVDARLVVEAFGIPGRHELDEVVIALIGLSQQHQVVVRIAVRAAFRVPAARRDVDLAAENRLHSALLRVIVKDDRREHVAMLGHRKRRHLEPGRLVEQLVDATCPVE